MIGLFVGLLLLISVLFAALGDSSWLGVKVDEEEELEEDEILLYYDEEEAGLLDDEDEEEELE